MQPNYGRVLSTVHILRAYLNRHNLLDRVAPTGYGLAFLCLHYLSRIPSQTVRHGILRLLGLRLGRSSVIHMGTEVRRPSGISIGDQTIVGHRCVLDGRGGLRIGSNVNLSSEAMIWTAQHDPQSEHFETRYASVVIEDYAWVSCRTVVLPGVTIGRGAVVAAGAVVTTSVDPFTIVGGVPAKSIGKRNPNLTYNLADGGTPWFI